MSHGKAVSQSSLLIHEASKDLLLVLLTSSHTASRLKGKRDKEKVGQEWELPSGISSLWPGQTKDTSSFGPKTRIRTLSSLPESLLLKLPSQSLFPALITVLLNLFMI